MSIEIRPITEKDLPEFVAVASLSFASHPEEQAVEDAKLFFQPGRGLAAFDGGTMVGTAGSLAFELTLPGLTMTPAAGVTEVGVKPTYRRRGILTKMMRYQLDRLQAEGESVAILYASESLIYGRFGYGLASTQTELSIDTRHSAFNRAPESDGSIALIDKSEAETALPAIYDRFRRQQPAALSRPPEYWKMEFKDRERWRHGASANFYAVYTSAGGEPQAFAVYRVKSNWDSGFPSHTLQIGDMAATSPEAWAAIWRYCLSVDLVGTVEAGNQPLDEPARWMLLDPRRLQTTALRDSLWLRVLDVPKALSARGYSSEGDLVISITDPFCPGNDGSYALSVQGGEGTACWTEKEADLAMQIDDLGAAYLGGVRFSTLARAGRVEERSSGALLRADAMFSSDPLPYCTTHF
ncbi:MAG: GNAT family N-acetyltransferase [Chloroflexota bacterium]